ncbi:MAG: DUF4251 domain-containing protein [Rikenellaceae bacterium]
MKNLLLSLVSVLALSATSFDLMAQQTRKEKHQEENQALNQQLSNAIQQQDFQFLATEIIYGQDPNLQNIPLYQLYGIWISPDYLKIYLPLYGPNNFNGQPSLMHKLDFFVNSYKYSTEPIKNGGWQVTVVATDPWSINTYTFIIRTTPSGTWSYMSVDTPFVGPVSYNGNAQTTSSN